MANRYRGGFDLELDEDTKILRIVENDVDGTYSGADAETTATAWARVNELMGKHKGLVLQKSSFYIREDGVDPIVVRNRWGNVNIMLVPHNPKYGNTKKTNYKKV